MCLDDHADIAHQCSSRILGLRSSWMVVTPDERENCRAEGKESQYDRPSLLAYAVHGASSDRMCLSIDGDGSGCGPSWHPQVKRKVTPSRHCHSDDILVGVQRCHINKHVIIDRGSHWPKGSNGSAVVGGTENHHPDVLGPALTKVGSAAAKVGLCNSNREVLHNPSQHRSCRLQFCLLTKPACSQHREISYHPRWQPSYPYSSASGPSCVHTCGSMLTAEISFKA